MLGDVFGSDPWFDAHMYVTLPSFVKVVEDRLKSTSGMFVERTFRHRTEEPIGSALEEQSGKTVVAPTTYGTSSRWTRYMKPERPKSQQVTVWPTGLARGSESGEQTRHDHSIGEQQAGSESGIAYARCDERVPRPCTIDVKAVRVKVGTGREGLSEVGVKVGTKRQSTPVELVSMRF